MSKNCPNCGAVNTNDATFCINCGAILEATPSENNNKVTPKTSKPKITNKNLSNPKKRETIILIILIILVITIVGAFTINTAKNQQASQTYTNKLLDEKINMSNVEVAQTYQGDSYTLNYPQYGTYSEENGKTIFYDENGTILGTVTIIEGGSMLEVQSNLENEGVEIIGESYSSTNLKDQTFDTYSCQQDRDKFLVYSRYSNGNVYLLSIENEVSQSSLLYQYFQTDE